MLLLLRDSGNSSTTNKSVALKEFGKNRSKGWLSPMAPLTCQEEEKCPLPV